MIKNLTRYTLVVRRDSDGFASACGKVRREGEWIKFSDVKELLQTSYNKQLPCHFLDNIGGCIKTVAHKKCTSVSKVCPKCSDTKVVNEGHAWRGKTVPCPECKQVTPSK